MTQRPCDWKRVYFDKSLALAEAQRLFADTGEIVYPYRCPWCLMKPSPAQHASTRELEQLVWLFAVTLEVFNHPCCPSGIIPKEPNRNVTGVAKQSPNSARRMVMIDTKEPAPTNPRFRRSANGAGATLLLQQRIIIFYRQSVVATECGTSVCFTHLVRMGLEILSRSNRVAVSAFCTDISASRSQSESRPWLCQSAPRTLLIVRVFSRGILAKLLLVCFYARLADVTEAIFGLPVFVEVAEREPAFAIGTELTIKKNTSHG